MFLFLIVVCFVFWLVGLGVVVLFVFCLFALLSFFFFFWGGGSTGSSNISILSLADSEQ